MPKLKAECDSNARSVEPTPSADIWERAFATYMDLLRKGKMRPVAAKEVMDEALAYIERESEKQARWDREGLS